MTRKDWWGVGVGAGVLFAISIKFGVDPTGELIKAIEQVIKSLLAMIPISPFYLALISLIIFLMWIYHKVVEPVEPFIEAYSEKGESGLLEAILGFIFGFTLIIAPTIAIFVFIVEMLIFSFM